MSTPEERLRQRAERLEADRVHAQQRGQENEAEARAALYKRQQQAATEAQVWLKRLDELVKATQRRVPSSLKRDIGEGPGFELTVGTARFRAVLEPGGWRVVQATHSIHPQTGLDPDISAIREQVLERMVNQGLDDLYEGRVRPSPEFER